MKPITIKEARELVDQGLEEEIELLAQFLVEADEEMPGFARGFMVNFPTARLAKLAAALDQVRKTFPELKTLGTRMAEAILEGGET